MANDVPTVFSFYEFADVFIIKPNDSNICLSLDRQTFAFTLIDQTGVENFGSPLRLLQIYGILGTVNLVAGPYLVVLTDRKFLGVVVGHEIWKLVQAEIIPIKASLFSAPPDDEIRQENDIYLSMLKNILDDEYLYFSYTYDLTHTMERLSSFPPEFGSRSRHERAESRFLWNVHLLSDFIDRDNLQDFAVGLINGFVSISSFVSNGKAFQCSILSRRSSQRAGVRLFVRGLDEDGNAANCVETEQIIEYSSYKCSFVQTRGSVPLFWSQQPNLKYKPNPLIRNDVDHTAAFTFHFSDQLRLYGRQVLINLVNQHGSEQLLHKAFSQLVTSSEMSNLKYVAFDFHRECSKMRWDRLNILLDQLEGDRTSIKYFIIDRDVIIDHQDGVFRTNCVDCLDRTNVVQSMLARRTLEDQLHRIGLLSQSQSLEHVPGFKEYYGNIWADNADALSVQYAGTGALKTDFTRTGRRTILGALKDGYNSAIRYFKNNFYDGFRQDCFDLFLGKVMISRGLLAETKDWKFYALPTVFLVAFTMLCVTILIPDEHLTEQMLYVLFWGSACATSLLMIFYFGSEFVNKPKLKRIHID